jgi:NAD+-dependent secondary alcohol dehydrogenase Adh1
VQIVRALAPPAYIVALDVDPDRIDAALSLGADSGSLVDDAEVDDLTGVLDFVGSDATLAWAGRVTHPPIVVFGRGGECSRSAAGPCAPACTWSARAAARSPISSASWRLAQAGRITVSVTPYPLQEVERAYADLRSGRHSGRAVVTISDL